MPLPAGFQFRSIPGNFCICRVDYSYDGLHRLIDAARSTSGVLSQPKPFVLETELQDYYPCYLIDAYIKDADKLAQITSDLHQNIRDTFNEAGVEIMSPHYFAKRDGSASTIPEDYLKSELTEGDK